MKLLLLFLICTFTSPLFSQTLKGQVLDSMGEGIPFASIRLDNSTYGTVANGEGKFVLHVTTKTIRLIINAEEYKTLSVNIVLEDEIHIQNFTLQINAIEIEEVIITKKTQKDRGKEIMKEVIDRRSTWENALENYDVNMYYFSSIEQQIHDSIVKDSIISKKKMNINEQYSHSYCKWPNQFKDSILGVIDLSDKGKNSGAVSVNFGSMDETSLQPQNADNSNPYLFVQGIESADFNLFKNQQNHPNVSQRSLQSPLAVNAFLNYNFKLVRSFYNENSEKIFEISLSPKFKEEALYSGRLFIREESYELINAELKINSGALHFFKEFHLLIDFEKVNSILTPVRKEFSYTIKEGRKIFNGSSRIKYSNHSFEKLTEKPSFWLATQVTDSKAYDRDSSFWKDLRTIPLKTEEIEFIHQQDSIAKYYESEIYLTKQDSTYNNLNIWSFLFNGVGHRNTFKGYEIFFPSLMNQVVPFGVGGYRHRFNVNYSKELKNGKTWNFFPQIDYGFTNKDLKWEFEVAHMYNPKKFARFKLAIGDVYDFMNNYQSLQGSFAPANRVRNKKVSLSHSREIINGLYGKIGVSYSDRQSVANLINPSWNNVFGNFAVAAPFDGYTIFMSNLSLEYHFRQKYLLKKDRKIIIGSAFPILSLEYKKAYPKFLGGQSDFDYLELELTDKINLKQFGQSEIKLVSGQFLRKKDLRIVEYKFFRTSDSWFFSNPINSMQKLDTALSTSNNFLQFNFIHHFQGFFLNKIWGINKLKLQETIGGSFVGIPEAKFTQVELYVGLEKQIRIRKQLFKVGVYAVTSDSNFEKANISYKFGINFYNSFYKRWDY